MFEHRLGLALGRTIAEIRSMPYPEYRRWALFYMLEPWGWQNDEYLTATITSRIYNVNCGKKKQRGAVDDMRNMQKSVLEQLKPAPDLSAMTPEDRKAFIIAAAKRDFGGK